MMKTPHEIIVVAFAIVGASPGSNLNAHFGEQDPLPSGAAFGAVGLEQVVIDPSGIAFERTIGDVGGDGDTDILATALFPDNLLWLYRAPEFTRTTLR